MNTERKENRIPGLIDELNLREASPADRARAVPQLIGAAVEQNFAPEEWNAKPEEERQSVVDALRSGMQEKYEDVWTVEMEPERKETKKVRVGGAWGRPGIPARVEEREVTIPARRRPLYDADTEEMIARAQEGELPDFGEMDPDDILGMYGLLHDAAPNQQAALDRAVREKARNVLAERGYPTIQPGDSSLEVGANEFAKQWMSMAGPMGAGQVADLGEWIRKQQTNLLRKVPMIGEPAADALDAVHDSTRERNLMTADNRALAMLAYGDEQQISRTLGTVLPYFAMGNAALRQVGQRMPGKAANMTRTNVPFSRNPTASVKAGRRVPQTQAELGAFSTPGIATIGASSALVGGAQGPEYVPSMLAEWTGLPQNRLTSALEAGGIDMLFGTALRAIGQSKLFQEALHKGQIWKIRSELLKRAKEHPGYENIKSFEELKARMAEDMRVKGARDVTGTATGDAPPPSPGGPDVSMSPSPEPSATPARPHDTDAGLRQYTPADPEWDVFAGLHRGNATSSRNLGPDALDDINYSEFDVAGGQPIDPNLPGPESGAVEWKPSVSPSPALADVVVPQKGATARMELGAVEEVPLHTIAVRPELMQFKRIDGAAGTNKEDSIDGEDWDPLKGGNLLLWEPMNPAEYDMTPGERSIVANGHHRLHFANAKNVDRVNSQILREADGYTASAVRAMAAEINIADGKGSIYDQAKYFRDTAATYGADDAIKRGREIGAKGRKAATIGIEAADNLFHAFINNVVTPEQAAAIAATAPGDEGMQALGIQLAASGRSPELLQYDLQLIERQRQMGGRADQIDLFGTDDSALLEMQKTSERAVALQQTLRESINAVRGAAKNPERARELGVDVNDPEAVTERLAGLQQLVARAKRFTTDEQVMEVLSGAEWNAETAARRFEQMDAQSQLDDIRYTERAALEQMTPEDVSALKLTRLKSVEHRGNGIHFVPESLMTRNRKLSLIPKEQQARLILNPRGGKLVEVKPWADVTGNPGDRGWAVIDRRASRAFRSNSPVSVEAVDTYGIRPPDGYIKQGDIYVFQSADPVTRDESGNIIPLSQRFNPESDSILHEPARAYEDRQVNRRYMELAKDPDGNAAELQRMVDEAAKAAGYDVGPVYHGGSFNPNVDPVFKVPRGPQRKNKWQLAFGVHFAETPVEAGAYIKKGGVLQPSYLYGNIFDATSKEVIPAESLARWPDSVRNRIDRFNEQWNNENTYAFQVAQALDEMPPNQASEAVLDAGYAGIKYQARANIDNKGYRPFNAYVVVGAPSQIKSADPVTRDESGNIIPLSQRFNPESDSILHEPAPPAYLQPAEAAELNTLQRKVLSGKALSQADTRRMELLQRKMGQQDFEFYQPEGMSAEVKGITERMREEMAAQAEARLQGGEVTSQGDLFGPQADASGQMSLFEAAHRYAARESMARQIADPARQREIFEHTRKQFDEIAQQAQSYRQPELDIGDEVQGPLFSTRVPTAVGGGRDAGDALPGRARAILAGDADAIDTLAPGETVTNWVSHYVYGSAASWNPVGANVRGPADMAALRMELSNPYREVDTVTVVNRKTGRIVGHDLGGIGSVTASLASDESVVRAVNQARRAGTPMEDMMVYEVHNHPGGIVNPSADDQKLYRHHREQVEALGLAPEQYDHLVTNTNKYHSINEGADGSLKNAKPFAWEITPRSQLAVGSPEFTAKLVQTLRQSRTPRLYAIGLNNQNNVVAVQRLPYWSEAPMADLVYRASAMLAEQGGLRLALIDSGTDLVRSYRSFRDGLAKATGRQDTLVDAGDASIPSYYNFRLLNEATAPPRQLTRHGQALEDAGAQYGDGRSPLEQSQPTGTGPEWVRTPAETPLGRKLLKGLKGDTSGRNYGPRSIVDFVNDMIGVQMRRSQSQTSAKHPAHYRKNSNVAMTRAGQSQINFHEAGHGLDRTLRNAHKGILDPLEKALIALTHEPGSMASAANSGEGLAEWVRLRLVDPSSIENMPLTRNLVELIDKVLPGMNASLRDAGRAWNAYQSLPPLTRWKMLNRDVSQMNPYGRANLMLLANGVNDWIGKLAASGSPLSALDRRMFRRMKKEMMNAGNTYRRSVEAARTVRRDHTAPLMWWHNAVLNIGSETQQAMMGKGDLKGIRIVGDGLNYKVLSSQTWEEVVKTVPPHLWQDFQHAGWALESLNRFTSDGMVYAGYGEGMTPADLANIVADVKARFPGFAKSFAAVQQYFDALLDVRVAGGLVDPSDLAKIKKRELYWPLPKIMWGGSVTPSKINTAKRGRMESGLHRAHGSTEAIRDLYEVAEQRTRDAFTGYYWNNLGLAYVGHMQTITGTTKYPLPIRDMAARQMLPLKMPRAVAATMSKDEVLPMVYESFIDSLAELVAIDPETLKTSVPPDKINIAWDFKDIWRPTDPKDYHVVSLLRDGKREFYQIEDVMMFRYFAETSDPGVIVNAINWAFGPEMQNWKRNITQSAPFAVANLVGDVFNQMALGRAPINWLGGSATALGILNRFTKKYPQVFDQGLLLSRAEPSSAAILNQLRETKFMNFLKEGFYVSNHKNPAARLLLTALQPANYLYPIHKSVDAVNLAGGKQLAQFFESATREGAAVNVKMRGGSDLEARDAYWGITGRFNEHSGVGDVKGLMAMPGFLNPTIQAIRGGAQNATDPDPAVAGAYWFKVLAMIPSVFGLAAVGAYKLMSPEDRERERERPLEDRMGYYSVFGFRLRFPWGPEGMMGSWAFNATMDALLDRTPANKPRRNKLLRNRVFGMDSLNPMGFFGPQVKTLMEATVNWSGFYQRNIVSPWMIGLPESEQARWDTPATYKVLGGWLNYSPQKIEHIVRQGIARQADEMVKMVEQMSRGESLSQLGELPFVGRMFVKEPVGFGSQSVQDLSDWAEKAHRVNLLLKSKGWSNLGDTQEFPPDRLPRAQRAIQVQLHHLQHMMHAQSYIQDFTRTAKFMREIGNPTMAKNLERQLTVYAQNVLLHNPEATERMEAILDDINQLPPPTPEQLREDAARRFVR